MFDQEDGELNIAIGVVFGVIAMVIALVIGMGVYQLRGHAAASGGATVKMVSAPTRGGAVDEGVVFVEIAEIGKALTVVYFDFGGSELPANAGDALAMTVVELSARPDARVLLSGFHDAAGSAEANAAVARKRALAVRAALVDLGVPVERVLLRKPAETLGGDDAARARRVEIRVQ